MTILTTMAAATVASSQPLRFHSGISLDDINFYTAPPEKPKASQHYAITASEANVSNTPKKRRIKKGRVPRFPPIDDPVKYLGWLCEDPEAFDEYEDIHENTSNSQDARGSNQANPIFIEDNTADLDLEPKAKGDGAGNTGNEANKVGDQLAPHGLGGGNNSSDEDDEDEELPSLEELEDLFGASAYNHLKPTAEFNEMDSLAEGIDVATVPQAIQKLETHVVANRDSSIANDADNIDNPLIMEEGNYEKGNAGGELSLMPKKRKLNQLERDDVTNHNSNNPTKESSGGSEDGKDGDSPRPQKQQRPPAYREDLSSSPPIPPILDLDSQYPQVDQQAVSTPQPASPSLQEPTLLHGIEPPHDEASSHIHNEGDGNSDGVADNQSDVSNPEPAVKRRTRAKKDKFNEMNLHDEWEIDDILGERMTKSGREYKVAWKPTWVHKSGLSNSKDALKSYQRRVRHAKVGSLQVHSTKVKGRAAVRKGRR